MDETTVDLGSWNGRLLLTGAGFTKNFGGFLGSEVYQQLLLAPQVRGDKDLFRLAHEHPDDFEAALHACRTGRLAAKYQYLESAIRDIYIRMDERIRLMDPPELSLLNSFRSLYQGLMGPDGTTFVFTLNQDLLFERRMSEQVHPRGGCLPGVPRQALNANAKASLDPYSPADDVSIPTDSWNDDVQRDLLGKFNYIKLHGSFNWTSQNGQEMMVIGGEKQPQIDRYPLLAGYQGLFRQLMTTPSVRVMIVGYGFRDRHINRELFDSAGNKNSQLFVVSPERPGQLKSRLQEEAKRAGIADPWYGVVPYQATLSELLTSSQGRDWEFWLSAFTS